MISIGVRYLCGYAVASDPSAKGPEWPPHPGRVFMAMAAAHFEGGADPDERSALAWLEETSDPPALLASGCHERTAVQAYVPVNDATGGITRRSKQARTFHKARLDDDTIFLVWDAEPSAKVRFGLERICSKVTRIGHSSSLVQMWVVPMGEEPRPNWIPDELHATRYLRIAEPGTLLGLEVDFNGAAIAGYDELAESLAGAKGKRKNELKEQLGLRFPHGRPEYRRPQVATWQGYSYGEERSHAENSLTGPFEPELLILTKESGRRLGLESTLQLTGALRDALFKAAPQGDQPEWFTGHRADGTPTDVPHVAVFPLAFVDADHADGHVMGLAIAVPRGIDVESARRFSGPLFFDRESGNERSVKLWKTGLWEWTLVRESRADRRVGLQGSTWTGPATVWASVTPVVLHHYPKKSHEGDVERIVRESFRSALLPEPVEIEVGPVSKHAGAGHVREIPPFEAGGERLCRYQVHAVARFEKPVEGPVLVGRGRFRGYGLFRPLRTEDDRR